MLFPITYVANLRGGHLRFSQKTEAKLIFCFVHLFGKKTKNYQYFCAASVFFHWSSGLIQNCDRL